MDRRTWRSGLKVFAWVAVIAFLLWLRFHFWAMELAEKFNPAK
jgi:cyanate permease